MTIHVIGHSRGLGKNLYDRFRLNFDSVKGYSRSNGYDIEADIIKICETINSDDIVILNAYANGSQIKYLKLLKDRNIKIIVMGSIAAVLSDSSRIEYSLKKKELEDYFVSISPESKIPLLYLRLTGSSYKNDSLIYNSIQFWIDNPCVNFIGYDTNE